MSRLFAVGSLLFVGAALRDQSIAVKGRLICGANPAADVLVKLWDEDIDVNAFSWLDPHDLLDFNYSNSNGEFELAGATTEFTAMEPVLSVYHDCNDGIKSGVRKFSIGLPDHYITAGKTPLKTVDIGIINLELSYKEEERVDDDEEEILTKMLLLPVLFVGHSLAFFFPIHGSGCKCTPCPEPATCPPGPSCAIPLPCPRGLDYAAPARSGAQSQVAPHLAVPPNYHKVQPVYQTVVPASVTSYVAPEPRYLTPVQPIHPVQTAATTDQYIKGTQKADQLPTLTPPLVNTQTTTYAPDAEETADTEDDDSSLALLPPTNSESVEGIDEITDTTGIIEENDLNLQENEDRLTQDATEDDENSIEPISTFTSLQSGNEDEPWIAIPLIRSRITTEGFAPIGQHEKRYMILKQLRNDRQMRAIVPRTNTTCNSHKLANVMARVMVDDVTMSKRTVLRATEMAFDGEKFDVFCANGEFSYSIHSRKYCEVTKNETTCFAFR